MILLKSEERKFLKYFYFRRLPLLGELTYTAIGILLLIKNAELGESKVSVGKTPVVTAVKLNALPNKLGVQSHIQGKRRRIDEKSISVGMFEKEDCIISC